MFQDGMQKLQHRAYADAARVFRAVVDGYPAERAVLDRARVYLELCERELDGRSTGPITLEERLTAATAALNDGDDRRAEHLARAVLKENARHELALYLMAAVEARRGGHDAAMDFLSRAVAVSPEVRAQARYDEDFGTLRESEAFQALIEPDDESPQGRRGRRG